MYGIPYRVSQGNNDVCRQIIIVFNALNDLLLVPQDGAEYDEKIHGGTISADGAIVLVGFTESAWAEETSYGGKDLAAVALGIDIPGNLTPTTSPQTVVPSSLFSPEPTHAPTMGAVEYVSTSPTPAPSVFTVEYASISPTSAPSVFTVEPVVETPSPSQRHDTLSPTSVTDSPSASFDADDIAIPLAIGLGAACAVLVIAGAVWLMNRRKARNTRIESTPSSFHATSAIGNARGSGSGAQNKRA